jgi:hypothetical protein
MNELIKEEIEGRIQSKVIRQSPLHILVEQLSGRRGILCVQKSTHFPTPWPSPTPKKAIEQVVAKKLANCILADHFPSISGPTPLLLCWFSRPPLFVPKIGLKTGPISFFPKCSILSPFPFIFKYSIYPFQFPSSQSKVSISQIPFLKICFPSFFFQFSSLSSIKLALCPPNVAVVAIVSAPVVLVASSQIGLLVAHSLIHVAGVVPHFLLLLLPPLFRLSALVATDSMAENEGTLAKWEGIWQILDQCNGIIKFIHFHLILSGTNPEFDKNTHQNGTFFC